MIMLRLITNLTLGFFKLDPQICKTNLSLLQINLYWCEDEEETSVWEQRARISSYPTKGLVPPN